MKNTSSPEDLPSDTLRRELLTCFIIILYFFNITHTIFSDFFSKNVISALFGIGYIAKIILISDICFVAIQNGDKKKRVLQA